MTILKGRLKFGWTLLNQSTVYRNELGLTPLKQLFVAFNIGIDEMPSYADSESDDKTQIRQRKYIYHNNRRIWSLFSDLCFDALNVPKPGTFRHMNKIFRGKSVGHSGHPLYKEHLA